MQGLGKGLVGAVLKPVGGVVDFTSHSLDAIQHATTVTPLAVLCMRVSSIASLHFRLWLISNVSARDDSCLLMEYILTELNCGYVFTLQHTGTVRVFALRG